MRPYNSQLDQLDHMQAVACMKRLAACLHELTDQELLELTSLIEYELTDRDQKDMIRREDS